jgi:hypothetical protein
MPEHALTETIRRTAADLAGAPMDAEEIEHLAPRLADLLGALRALEEMGLEGVEPAFTED